MKNYDQLWGNPKILVWKCKNIKVRWLIKINKTGIRNRKEKRRGKIDENANINKEIESTKIRKKEQGKKLIKEENR